MKNLQINLGRIAKRPSCNVETTTVILGLTKVHPFLLSTGTKVNRQLITSYTWHWLIVKLNIQYAGYNLPDEPPEPNLGITPKFNESYAYYALISEYIDE